MTDHLNPKLKGWEITARVLFSFGVTALAVVASYFAIRWLAQQ